MSEFQTATEEFLSSLTYLGDLDSATLMSIRVAARELDADYRVTLATEYRRQKEAIQAMKPETVEVKKVDPLLAVVTGLETRGA